MSHYVHQHIIILLDPPLTLETTRFELLIPFDSRLIAGGGHTSAWREPLPAQTTCSKCVPVDFLRCFFSDPPCLPLC